MASVYPISSAYYEASADEYFDSLGPARGILFALLISVPLNIAIAYVIWLLVRAL